MNKRFLQQVVFGGSNSNSSQPPPTVGGGSSTAVEESPFPTIVALPSELVQLLDEAAQGERRDEDFQQWTEALAHQLDILGLYTLHDAESKCVDEAKERLSNLSQSFSTGDLHSAVEHALLLFRSITRFEIQRKQNRQSQLDGVNEVLISGISVLQGRADPELLARFLPGLVEDIDRMVELFKQGEGHLPEEVKMAILTGLDRATKGVTSVQNLEPGDQAQLKKALTQVAEGAGLLEQLQTWKDEYDAEAGGAVPVAGLTVQDLLTELSKKGQLSEKSLRFWSEVEHPKFYQFWLKSRGSLLIRTEVREPTIEKIDRVVETLSDLPSLSPGEQNRALLELDNLFVLVSNNQMPISKLERSPNRWIGDLCLAIAAGGIPLFYLDKTYHDNNDKPESQELAKALDMYLETGDTDLVLTLLDDLLKETK